MQKGSAQKVRSFWSDLEKQKGEEQAPQNVGSPRSPGNNSLRNNVFVQSDKASPRSPFQAGTSQFSPKPVGASPRSRAKENTEPEQLKKLVPSVPETPSTPSTIANKSVDSIKKSSLSRNVSVGRLHGPRTIGSSASLRPKKVVTFDQTAPQVIQFETLTPDISFNASPDDPRSPEDDYEEEDSHSGFFEDDSDNVPVIEPNQFGIAISTPDVERSNSYSRRPLPQPPGQSQISTVIPSPMSAGTPWMVTAPSPITPSQQQDGQFADSDDSLPVKDSRLTRQSSLLDSQRKIATKHHTATDEAPVQVEISRTVSQKRRSLVETWSRNEEEIANRSASLPVEFADVAAHFKFESACEEDELANDQNQLHDTARQDTQGQLTKEDSTPSVPERLPEHLYESKIKQEPVDEPLTTPQLQDERPTSQENFYTPPDGDHFSPQHGRDKSAAEQSQGDSSGYRSASESSQPQDTSPSYTAARLPSLAVDLPSDSPMNFNEFNFGTDPSPRPSATPEPSQKQIEPRIKTEEPEPSYNRIKVKQEPVEPVAPLSDYLIERPVSFLHFHNQESPIKKEFAEHDRFGHAEEEEDQLHLPQTTVNEEREEVAANRSLPASFPHGIADPPNVNGYIPDSLHRQIQARYSRPSLTKDDSTPLMSYAAALSDHQFDDAASQEFEDEEEELEKDMEQEQDKEAGKEQRYQQQMALELDNVKERLRSVSSSQIQVHEQTRYTAEQEYEAEIKDEDDDDDEEKHAQVGTKTIGGVSQSGTRLRVRPSLTPDEVSRMMGQSRNVSHETRTPVIKEEPVEHDYVLNQYTPDPQPMLPTFAFDDIISENSMFEDLDKEFERVLKMDKTPPLPVEEQITQQQQHQQQQQPHRGYNVRETKQVVYATSDRRGSDGLNQGQRRVSGPIRKLGASAPAPAATLPPIPAGAQSVPTPSPPRVAKAGDLLRSPADPGTIAKETPVSSAAAQESAAAKQKRKTSELLDSDRGRLFVRVLSVRQINLPGVKTKKARFNMTLDNGLHSITTPYKALSEEVAMEQEFELIVGTNLEFILTLKGKWPKSANSPTMAKSPQMAAPGKQRPIHPVSSAQKQPTEKKHGFSKLFGSSRKKPSMAQLGPGARGTASPGLTPQASLAAQPAGGDKDSWDDLTAVDGSFGRVYVAFSQYESEVYGRAATFDIPCYNEWSTTLVKATTGPGSAKKVKREPYKIGSLQVQMMFVPRVSKKETMPQSIKEALNELRVAAALLKQAEAGEQQHPTAGSVPGQTQDKAVSNGASLPKLEGYLSQLGGDCKYWRRRYFQLDGATLTAYSETSHKPRVSINLRKAVRVVSDKSTLTQPTVLVGSDTSASSAAAGGRRRRKSAFAEQEEAFMFADEGFRIRFGNGEIIDFYADDGEAKRRWVEKLGDVMGLPKAKEGTTTTEEEQQPKPAELLQQSKQKIKPWVEMVLEKRGDGALV